MTPLLIELRHVAGFPGGSVLMCLPSRRLSLQVLSLVPEDLEKELGNICYRPVTKGNSEQPNGNAGVKV